MPTSTPSTGPVPAIPPGMHSLTPHLVCDDASAAIAFYEQAFGAVEMFRLPGPEGRLVHAMVRIGDSMLMLVDEFPDMGALGPKRRGGSSVTLHLAVPDAEATVAQAHAAGARVVMPVAEMFWGALYGVLEDPFGHVWSVATQIRMLTPEEIEARMHSHFGAAGPGTFEGTLA